MKTLALAISAVMLLVAAPAAAQQFYRYVDAAGHVRFTDDINQVPEKQRTGARSYVESRAAPTETKEAVEGAEPKATHAATEVAVAAPATGEDASDSARARIEDLKKQVEAEYQALLKQKDALAKEKETRKTRDQVADYNQRVEAFNQSAASYEAKSAELRKQVEEYNARVMEENARTSKSVQK